MIKKNCNWEKKVLGNLKKVRKRYEKKEVFQENKYLINRFKNIKKYLSTITIKTPTTPNEMKKIINKKKFIILNIMIENL